MDLAKKSQESVYCGPYKATRLWNDVVCAFRQYLPCGRHRRYMKTYDNCFSGTSAADWLLQYLKSNNNFNEDVSREKALSLLNKLYKAGIFEEVKVSKSMRHKPDVQENRLYKFLPASPSKMKIYRLPLAPRNDSGLLRTTKDHHSFKHEKEVPTMDKNKPLNENTAPKETSRLSRKISILRKDKTVKEEEPEKKESDNIPPCHLVTRVLTTKEIKDTWKTTFVHRLKNTLATSKLNGIIAEEDIDGYNIMHNCIYLNKSGIVTNINNNDQLPHWVMSAMKCLARWPEPPEPGLPNYPGFEKDVFGVVKEYFAGLDEPLVPYKLYDAFINVFALAGNNQPRHSSPQQRENDFKSSLWTSASLENIILDLTRKYCLLDNTGQHYGTHEDLLSAGLSQQHYGTQEDLRFLSHMDKSYLSYNNRRVYPSTDGMDKLTHSRKSYNNLPDISCVPQLSSFKSCHTLSKTTHSDGWNASIHNRSELRKYGSTPNLKVSRYETAFGPDNRTVTRIFYQNGMTTDYGHDDEDDDLYHLPLGSNLNLEKQTSLELERSSRSIHSNNQRVSLSSPLKESYCPPLESKSSQHSQNCTVEVNQSCEKISGVAALNDSCNKKYFSQQSLHDIEENMMNVRRSLSPPSGDTHQLSRTPSLIKAFGPGYRPVRSSLADSQKLPSSLEKAKRPLSEYGNSTLSREHIYPPTCIKGNENSNDSLNDYHAHSQSPKGYKDMCTPKLHLSHITPFCSTNKIQSTSNHLMNFPRSQLYEDRAKKSMQMVSLLLPPSNRRKLHLLFKMMTKMASNPNLCLDYTQTTRSLVLSVFYQSIIRCQEDGDLDEVVVLQLVSFMLDFYDEIFTPPPDIKVLVSNRLKILQRPQVVYSPRPERTVRFCEQTTVTDFENQRISTSQSALVQLLEGIIENKNMDLKDKKKHLKQFQKTYPNIYAQRFPTPELEAAILAPKAKVKKSVKTVPQTRLKGLRL